MTERTLTKDVKNLHNDAVVLGMQDDGATFVGMGTVRHKLRRRQVRRPAKRTYITAAGCPDG